MIGTILALSLDERTPNRFVMSILRESYSISKILKYKYPNILLKYDNEVQAPC